MSSILITIDSLRASRLSQFGHYRNTMPALDKLAAEGTVFTDTYSNAPYTRISIPSIHTSRHRGHALIGKTPTISQVLRESGVQTFCFGTRTGFKDTEGELLFDEYKDFGRDDFYKQANYSPFVDITKKIVKPAVSISSPIYQAAEAIHDRLFSTHEFKGYVNAQRLTDAVIDWLRDPPDRFFLWIHYMEGHRPYGIHNPDPEYVDESPSEGKIMTLMETAGTKPSEIKIGEDQLIKDLYDSDLRYCSDNLSRLFDVMEIEGLWEGTDIFLTSDHGEEFFDHGMYFHRNLPFDELLHVPLFVKLGSQPKSEKIGATRELLDLAPTICKELGVETNNLPFNGTHLFEGEVRRVIATGSAAIDNSAVVAGRWDDWKYIHNGGEDMLYDLNSDPDEKVSVAEEYPNVVEQFEAEIPDELYQTKSLGTRNPNDEVDKEQLAALGYLEV